MLTRKAKLHYAHEVHMTETFPVLLVIPGLQALHLSSASAQAFFCNQQKNDNQANNQACNKLYRCMTGCRFAEFALLEQPSCESLDQEPSPGPSQVEIVVQVSLHFP